MNSPGNGGGVSLAAIKSAAQLIVVGEDLGSNGDPEYYRPDAAGCANCFTLQNHLGMTNFLFADGHAKSLKPLATGQQLNMWTVDNSTTPGGVEGPAPASLLNELAARQAKMN